MFAHIQRSLDAARPDLEAATPLRALHEAIARNAERAEYGGEALAKTLGVSLRQLQRRIRAHGTTLRGLLEEARKRNAHKLLANRRLGVEEVAFLLGYSDDRAFRRAFKRWTGNTPSRFRKTQLRPSSA